MKRHLVSCLGLAIMFTLPGSAQAGLITYQFSGTVTNFVDSAASPQLPEGPSGIHEGSTATGTFSYDNSAPGTQFYRGAALKLSETVTIDGKYTFSLTTTGSGDEVDLDSGSFGLFKRGPDVPLPFGTNAQLSFLDAFIFASTSDDISKTSISLTPQSVIGISDAFSSTPYYYIGITPTTLELVNPSAATVPEPASIVAYGIGLTALLGYRRFRRRSVSV